jgi:two-component system nitrate/nitrite response regulator NarL
MTSEQPRTSIRIIIADDHPMVRDGLKVSLESEQFIEVIADVSNGLEAVQASEKLSPDVVLLDISMPEMNGLEACQKIREQSPNVGLLIVTMHDNREYITRVIQAGASGYVLKDAPTEEIILAVQTVNQGGTYFSSSVAKTLFSEITDSPQGDNKAGLSARETDVLAHLTEGLGNKEIARKMDISVRTVEAHRLKIKQKLGINNSAGLIRYAIDHGIGVYKE